MKRQQKYLHTSSSPHCNKALNWENLIPLSFLFLLHFPLTISPYNIQRALGLCLSLCPGLECSHWTSLQQCVHTHIHTHKRSLIFSSLYNMCKSHTKEGVRLGLVDSKWRPKCLFWEGPWLYQGSSNTFRLDINHNYKNAYAKQCADVTWW